MWGGRGFWSPLGAIPGDGEGGVQGLGVLCVGEGLVVGDNLWLRCPTLLQMAAGLWLLWVRVRGDVTARSLLGVLPLTASPWSCSSGHVLPAKPLAGSCPCPFPHLWAILAKPGPIRGCRMVGPRRRLSRGFPHPLDTVPSGPSPSLALFQFPDTSRCLILLRARGLCRKGTAPVEERQIK